VRIKRCIIIFVVFLLTFFLFLKYFAELFSFYSVDFSVLNFLYHNVFVVIYMNFFLVFWVGIFSG